MSAFKHFIEAILNPLCLCLVLMAFCLLFYNQKRRCVYYGLLASFLLLTVFSTSWLPRSLMHKLESQYPIVTRPDPRIHWIVVLSGGQANTQDLPNNLLYCASLKRLIEGVRLYRQSPAAQLLLSGGGFNGQEVPEATHMAGVAEWFAIPRQDIFEETASRNTADQAREIQKILGEKPFYLVTSAYHMPRSLGLFKQRHLNPVPAPTDFALFWQDERWEKRYIPNPQNLVYLSIALHEYLGMLSTWMIERAKPIRRFITSY